jgi:hypothetical protein
MLDSPILGAAIGLVLIFGTLALLCSGITETVSNRLQLRAKYLLTGLRSMLDAPHSSENDKKTKQRNDVLNDKVKNNQTTSDAAQTVRSLTAASAPPAIGTITTALFDSPLLKSLQSRRVGVFKNGTLRNPQYITGKSFARALVDLLVPATVDGEAPIQLDLAKVSAAIQQWPKSLPLKAQLLAFVSRAGGDLSHFEASLEQWYDEQMAVISGWYKRWSRVILGVVGLVVAILINIDTLQIAHALYVNSPAQQAVISTATAGTLCQNEATPKDRENCATDEIDQLQVAGVPIGYSSACDLTSKHWARCWSWAPTDPLHGWDLPLKLLGWAITAFAVSFGGPFWFEALSKLGSLRNTGTKPSSTTP